MSIQADIERCLVLEAEIAERQEELKAIKKRLETAALAGPHEPLEDRDREGRQYIARGTNHAVPIIITSDELVKSFQAESPLHIRLLELAGGFFPEFYAEQRTFKTEIEDGKEFRAKAVEVLGPKVAPQFITACRSVDKHGIPKNKIVIAVDRAEIL